MANGSGEHSDAKADAIREHFEKEQAEAEELAQQLFDADWAHEERTSPGLTVHVHTGTTGATQAVSAEQADAVLQRQPRVEMASGPEPNHGFWSVLRAAVNRVPPWMLGVAMMLAAAVWAWSQLR